MLHKCKRCWKVGEGLHKHFGEFLCHECRARGLTELTYNFLGLALEGAGEEIRVGLTTLRRTEPELDVVLELVGFTGEGTRIDDAFEAFERQE